MLQPKFLTLAAALILLLSSVMAQPQPLSAEQKKQQEERAKKALILLDEVLIEAQALKSLFVLRLFSAKVQSTKPANKGIHI